MAEFHVYRSDRSKSYNDSETFDWELDLHWDDGAVTRFNYSDHSWYQIEEICFETLCQHPGIEQIFIWQDDLWWGGISRSQEM